MHTYTVMSIITSTRGSNDNAHKPDHIIINFTHEGWSDSLALNISVRNKRKDKESGYKKLKYMQNMLK